MIYILTSCWLLLVRQKNLKVHVRPGVPRLVPSSVILGCSAIVLQDGGDGATGQVMLVQLCAPVP